MSSVLIYLIALGGQIVGGGLFAAVSSAAPPDDSWQSQLRVLGPAVVCGAASALVAGHFIR